MRPEKGALEKVSANPQSTQIKTSTNPSDKTPPAFASSFSSANPWGPFPDNPRLVRCCYCCCEIMLLWVVVVVVVVVVMLVMSCRCSCVVVVGKTYSCLLLP